jgi:hypothetical protein
MTAQTQREQDRDAGAVTPTWLAEMKGRVSGLQTAYATLLNASKKQALRLISEEIDALSEVASRHPGTMTAPESQREHDHDH